MLDSEQYSVCGVLVHARPGSAGEVRERLLAEPGVEVHAQTDEGRMVVSVESGDPNVTADTLQLISNLDGVLSAAMVYQYSDSDEQTAQEN
ncbi:MAG: chaperone NapD [Pseudomonadota bacterium]|nr:MAG: chaperone NapD [Pseudomonadota bacterium]